MKIKLLPQEVRSYLRTGVAITSVIQCVEELVLNALDAGATCVAIRIDLTCFKVQVVDNGSGVLEDELEFLGNRFCTSKCHDLSDLDNLCHYGYRGEALASIRDACSVLEIVTRTKSSSKTFCKLFQQGKSYKVCESSIPRPSVGTTVTVHDLFMNFPVRQKSMNKAYELEKVRETLEGIVLVRPGISVSLRNDATGHVIFQTRKCSDPVAVFSQLYGTGKSEMLESIHGETDSHKISGYIGRDGHSRKNLQFVYVNHRLVKKSKIHKLLNKVLATLPSFKTKLKQSPEGENQYVFKTTPKFSEAYPVYILQVKCPLSEYDITFEPAKTLVEFKNWDTLLRGIEKLAKKFVEHQTLVFTGKINNPTPSEKTPQKANGETENKNTKAEHTKVIAAENLTDVLLSKTAKKRKTLHEAVQESSSSDTPKNQCVIVCKAAVGLGSREPDTSTDIEEITDNIGTENGVISATSEVSKYIENKPTENMESSRESNSSSSTFNCKNLSALETQKEPLIDNSVKELNKPVSEKHYGGSLSRYKQSIGKFSSKGSASIEESLSKLRKILPQKVKAESHSTFSTLQKFRRRSETSKQKYSETNCLNFAKNVRPSPEYVTHHSKLNSVCENLSRNNNFGLSIKTTEDNLIVEKGSIESHITQGGSREKIWSEQNAAVSQNPTKDKASDLHVYSKDSPEFRAYKINALGNVVDTLPEREEDKLPVPMTTGIDNDDMIHLTVSKMETSDTSSSAYAYLGKNPSPIKMSRKRLYETNFQDKDEVKDKLLKHAEIAYTNNSNNENNVCNITRRVFQTENSESTKTYKTCDISVCDAERETVKNCDIIVQNTSSRKVSTDDNNVQELSLTVETNTGNIEVERIVPTKDSKKDNENNKQEASFSTVILNPNSESSAEFYSTQPFIPVLSISAETETGSMTNEIEIEEIEENIAHKTKTPSSSGFSPILNMSESASNTPDQMSRDFLSPGVMNVNKKEAASDAIGGDLSCHIEKIKEIRTEETLNEEVRNDTLKFEEPKLITTQDSDSVTLTQLLKSVSQFTDRIAGIETEEGTNTSEKDDKAVEALEVSQPIGFTFSDIFDQTPVTDRETSNLTYTESGTAGTEKDDIFQCSMFSEADWVQDIDNMEPKSSDPRYGNKKDNRSDGTENAECFTSVGIHRTEGCGDSEIAGPSESPGVVHSSTSRKLLDGDADDEDHMTTDENIKWREQESKIESLTTLDKLPITVPQFTGQATAENLKHLHTCTFSKQSLQNIKVLGQLDKKFIVCLFNDPENTDTDCGLLVLVDQHAAHERIRLEVLTEDAFVDGVKGGQLNAFIVDPPRLLVFTEAEVRNIDAFKTQFSRIGITVEKKSPTTVSVRSIPECLVWRKPDVDKIYWSTIQVLMREHIAVFMSTRGAQGIVPQTIHKVLCSLACKGAIKFGDRLSGEECSRLVADLSLCDLPFQCAHGRPSVNPLLHLDSLDKLRTQERKKPQLWKLTQKINRNKESA